MRDGGLTHQERSREIHGEHAVPIRERKLVRVPEFQDSRDVAQHVELAELRERGRDGLLDLRGIRDVAAQRMHLGTQLAHALGGLLEPRELHVADHECRPLARQPFGRGPADARSRAGHQCNLVLESLHDFPRRALAERVGAGG